jgi:hypothetical protein
LRVLGVAGADALAFGSPGSRSSSDVVATSAVGGAFFGADADGRFVAFGGVAAAA